MKKKRNDTWTTEQDVLLADTIVEYVKTGRSISSACREVGKLINRTEGACSLRWKQKLKKIYSDHLELAKKTTMVQVIPSQTSDEGNHGKEKIEQTQGVSEIKVSTTEVPMLPKTSFIKMVYEHLEEYENMQMKIVELKLKIKVLERENSILKNTEHKEVMVPEVTHLLEQLQKARNFSEMAKELKLNVG
jgi:prespore-specific regulator